MRLGTSEIILIIILALVLFGGGKIAGLGKALGQSIHDFKKALKDGEDESASNADSTKTESKEESKK